MKGNSEKSLAALDKWALENIIDAEKESKEETEPRIKGYLLGVIVALKDVRVKIAELNSTTTADPKKLNP